MTKQPSEHDAIAELAPFYVVGALSSAETARFEAALARDPDLARNVAAARAERDQALGLGENLPAPTARALNSLLERIRNAPAPKPGLWARLDLGATLAKLFSPRALGWATAAACLLAGFEAGVLALQSSQKPASTFAAASRTEASAQGGTFVLVAFTPAANVEAITKLLAATGARIVEGPLAQGFYRIRLGGPDVARAEAQRRLERLRQAGALAPSVEPSR